MWIHSSVLLTLQRLETRSPHLEARTAALWVEVEVARKAQSSLGKVNAAQLAEPLYHGLHVSEGPGGLHVDGLLLDLRQQALSWLCTCPAALCVCSCTWSSPIAVPPTQARTPRSHLGGSHHPPSSWLPAHGALRLGSHFHTNMGYTTALLAAVPWGLVGEAGRRKAQVLSSTQLFAAVSCHSQ